MFWKRRTPYYQEIAAFIEKYYIQPASVPEARIVNLKSKNSADMNIECENSAPEDSEDEVSVREDSGCEDSEWVVCEGKDSESEAYEDDACESEASILEAYENEVCEDAASVKKPPTPASAEPSPHFGRALKTDKLAFPADTNIHRKALPSRAPKADQPKQAFLCGGAMPSSLEETLDQVDESFSEMLLRKIDESGMTDSQCYRKAHIDRRLFSKIRSNPQYQPSRQTVIAFGIALELPLDEMKELLEKAGFALSHANKADLIVEFFIRRGNYNLYEINEALSAFGQTLLGA